MHVYDHNTQTISQTSKRAFLGTKVYVNGSGYMTKMAVVAFNNKNVYNLQNQKAYDFETLHEALGNGALQSMYKS